jgi:hypothetical protein
LKAETQNGERAKDGTTDLAGAQAAAIGTHGPDQFFVPLAQLFLPDRKNGLASMVALLEHLYRFFSHLIGCHRSTTSLDPRDADTHDGLGGLPRQLFHGEIQGFGEPRKHGV